MTFVSSSDYRHLFFFFSAVFHFPPKMSFIALIQKCVEKRILLDLLNLLKEITERLT